MLTRVGSGDNTATGYLFYNTGMEIERFEELVLAAVEALPEEFRELLENVDIVVEELPSAEQRRKAGRRHSLLGLYEGVPRTGRGAHYQLVVPDKITLFQQNIEDSCATPEDIPGEIEKVVRHEIAHHFGMTDEELARIERRHRSARRK
jgi:predicted Zn-dependent protease with MMP-like domain